MPADPFPGIEPAHIVVLVGAQGGRVEKERAGVTLPLDDLGQGRGQHAGRWHDGVVSLFGVNALDVIDNAKAEAALKANGLSFVPPAAGEWFVAATLRFAPGDAAAAQQRVRELLDRRAATQPTKQPSGGSTFRVILPRTEGAETPIFTKIISRLDDDSMMKSIEAFRSH